MLYIWTAAKSHLITETFGASLQALPSPIQPHKFIPWEAGQDLPQLQAGDVLLAAGDKVLSVLKKHGVVSKAKKVGGMREHGLSVSEGTCLVTYDPGVISSQPENKSLIDWDVRLAVRLHNTGSMAPTLGKYRYVSDYSDVIDRIETLYEETGKSVDVALDLETMGFVPYFTDKDIISVQVTVDPGTADVLYLGPQEHPIKLDKTGVLFDQVDYLLTSPHIRLRGANLKFDLTWISVKWGIQCTNFKFDTMLVGSLLDENRSNSLNTHAKAYTSLGGYDDSFNAKYNKGKMEEVPPDEEFLTYAGGDTDACQQCANALKKELLQDEKLTKFYINILHPTARAFEKVEQRGVLADQEAFAVLREDLTKEIDEGYTTALDLLPNKMKIKYRDRIDDQITKGQSPMLPSILKEYFFSPHGLNLKPKEFTPKTGEPTMAKSHLKMFDTHPEAMAMVKALTTLDVSSKTRSTFVDGFLKHLCPDGRFHSTYFLGHAEYEGFGGDSGTDCVTADTLFMTNQGQIPYTDLRVGDMVIDHEGIPQPIVALHDNGVKPVLSVTTEDGFTIKCTENHPFRINDQWVKASDLQVGDHWP